MRDERHNLMSAQARYAAYAAKACGYAFASLDGSDGYLFEVSDGARKAAFAAGAGSPYALNDMRAASIARDKAFCADVLRRAGVPVVPGERFFVTKRWAYMRTPGREPEDALAYARTAQFPLFCKPLSASNGLYAEVVEDLGGFADYMQRVSSLRQEADGTIGVRRYTLPEAPRLVGAWPRPVEVRGPEAGGPR